MRHTKTKTLLAVLLSIALFAGSIGTMFAASGRVFPWRAQKNSVEKIIERDGYLEGIWYPWFTHRYLGCGLTSNEVMTQYVGNSFNVVGIDEYGERNIYREIYNLKALGFNMMGYEGSPYGEGVIFDANGDVIGIKDEYLSNVRRFLDICREVKMPVFWVVCFHSSTIPSYYGMPAWNVITQMYARPEVADHYAERFVKPLCDVLAEYPDVVVMAAATSEAENEINDSEVGNHFDTREVYGVNREPMQYFINKVTDTLAEKLPDVSRTLCINSNNIAMYSDVDLDFFGHQIYNSNGSSQRVETYKATAPMIVTEFGVGDGSSAIAEEILGMKQLNFRDGFIENGFKGWFMWCWQPNSFGTSYSLLSKDALTVTDFRPTAYSLHFYITDYRNAHRGVESTIDTPVMFYQNGTGQVEWIASRQATKLDLLRSLDDGKTWSKILDNVNPLDYENNYKGSYKDTTLPQTGTVTYKVVVYDDEGNTVSAEPSNTINIKEPPRNLVTNGSFETGDFTDWNIFGENGVKLNAAITNVGSDAADGEHILDLAYTANQWTGVNQAGITVKPNTTYKLTFKYKKAEDCTANLGYCYIRGRLENGAGNGLGDINDEKITTHFMNQGNTTDWTTAEKTFKTYNSDKIGIDFRIITGFHFYIDDVRLIEVDN